MARKRMYMFERAYKDYGSRLARVITSLLKTCGSIWKWFWGGPAAIFFEVLLKIAVFLGAAVLCVLYVRYELGRGHGVSFGMVMTLGAIFVFALIVLGGWKTPIHIFARALAGAVASGLILALSSIGAVITGVFFFFYLLVLFTLTALSFIVFLPMRFAHWVWLRIRKIRYRCPYDGCNYSGMPIHVCSEGHMYPDLQPSFYGIFNHYCRHGDKYVKLPTMDFLGRNKLTRLCGDCGRPLIFRGTGEYAEFPIYLFGGPGSGKSVFLRQVVSQLPKAIEAIPRSRVVIDSEEQKRSLDQDLNKLDRGEVLDKTLGADVHAFGLAVTIPRVPKRLLYLYDAPGEIFSTVKTVGGRQAFQSLDGIVMIVDPFVLPMLSDSDIRKNPHLKPSGTTFKSDVDVLITIVNQMMVKRPTDKCKVPLAVVVTKTDALPVMEYDFLNSLCSQDGSLSDEERSSNCRDALIQLGGENSIRLLEIKFSKIRYFGCTALGRMPESGNREAFKPSGVVEPLLWLMKLDSAYAAARKKGAQRPAKSR